MEQILKKFEAAIKADVQPLLRQKADLAAAAVKAQKGREKAAVAEHKAAERHVEIDRTMGTISGREDREKAKERLSKAAVALAEARTATGQAKGAYTKLAVARNETTAQTTKQIAELLHQAREAFDGSAIAFIREGNDLHAHLEKIGKNLADSNGEGHQEIARALAPMAAKLDLFRAQFRRKDF